MDGGDAIHIDMEEILGVDFVFPMAYSNGTEDAEVVREEIMEKLKQLPSRSSDFSICRVPKLMFEESEKAYIPHMVSIGPIHHKQEHLQPMETRKMQYFKDFLSRSSPGKLRKYVKVVTDLTERAYRCYPEAKIETKSFVMMMVVDGCFILHLLLKYKENDYPHDEYSWIEYSLLDLILVENQLPFFILEELYQVFIADDSNGSPVDTCTLQDVVRQSLVTWVMRVLFDSSTDETTKCANAFKQVPPMGKPKHLLDFARKFIVPPSLPQQMQQQQESLPQQMQQQQEMVNHESNNQRLVSPSLPQQMQQQQQEMVNHESNYQRLVVRATRCLHHALECVLRLCVKKEDNLAKGYKVGEPMRCATELKNASVKFEKKKDPTNLLDINFDYAKGVLTIPPILVHDLTEPILRNLIAYEFFSDDYSYITEYVMFLNSLINSGNDVELLQESEIFPAILAQPSDVAKLFDSLNKYSTAGYVFTGGVSREVMKYSSRRRNKWKASLLLNYFNTPWALVSVVAAIILLVLTLTQTIFAALPYY